MQAITVELHVPDLEPAKHFYELLGFVEAWRDTRPGSQYLVMRLGETPLSFRLREHAHSYFGDIDEPRGVGVELVVSVAADQLDALYQKASKIAKVVADIQTRAWGLRDFRVADPFGYYLRFTEPSNVLTDDYGGRPPTGIPEHPFQTRHDTEENA